MAHNTHSLPGASVSMGGATTYISNLILTKGSSSFTDRDSLRKPSLALDSLA